MYPVPYAAFADRHQAGVQLAQKLSAWRGGEIHALGEDSVDFPRLSDDQVDALLAATSAFRR
jgi:predicted phosphoribosyltransferase